MLQSADCGVGGDDDDGSGPLAAAAVASSYVFDMRQAGIRSVRDAVFLEGYAEPVLLVRPADIRLADVRPSTDARPPRQPGAGAPCSPSC